jgi:hypothetical protein
MTTYGQVLEQRNESEQTAEKWVAFLNFLKAQGFMAEIRTQLEIRPVAEERPEELPLAAGRSIVYNVLSKQSRILSQKLREDFCLGQMADERIDFSLLDSSLSEYSDEKDAVELVRSSRQRS